MTNTRKEAQLGMPFGTAMHQIRKNLLFHLAQQLNLTICYRCGQQITCAEDLGIDHKQDWLHNDPSLFWDVENLAFSHRACNRPSRNRGPKIPVPDGQAWCSDCQSPLPIGDFYAVPSRFSGLDGRCKTCYHKARANRRARRKTR